MECFVWITICLFLKCDILYDKKFTLGYMIFILVYIFKKLKYTLISSHKSALEEFFWT